MPLVEYWIDDRRIELQVIGSTTAGSPRTLMDEDDNLIERSGWDIAGYAVADFLSDEDYCALCECIRQIIRQESKATGLATDESYTLENYHRVVNSDELHASIIRRTRLGYPLNQLPFPAARIVDRISEISNADVTVRHPEGYEFPFVFRIARPGRPLDGNPPHRDVWLDRLRNGLNIYVPIAGSNNLSSLPILPGSHKWAEDDIERTEEGALIGGLKYSVPAVTRTKRPFRMVRPNPGPNQVLMFSPYLIHGGARNFNEDRTRVSLEMRFWRKR